MEQFRQIGEVLGSLKALMLFRDEIKINQRQCTLLYDCFKLVFKSIGEEIKKHLKFDEKLAKWRYLEQPLKELYRIFREGEKYIRSCLEPKDWWGKAIALNDNTDCVDLHIHNLLWCVSVVIEAIEAASEVSGSDQEEMNMRRIMFSKKYDKDLIDPILFQHKLGNLYLVSQDMCRKFDSVLKEDRWLMSETIKEMRSSTSKSVLKISEILLSPKLTIHPCSVLLSSPDYQVRRRLGGNSNGNGIMCKEITWMGESFAIKHAMKEDEIEQLLREVSLHSTLSHPNIMSYMYAFCDQNKECIIVMDLMNKDLSSYIKEVGCVRKKVSISLLVAVDIMLQISRAMEYLHSKNIFHGDLNPANILVKAKTSTLSPDGYVTVKVANINQSSATSECIWYAPEVLADTTGNCKYTEKADVYSFGMICFEVLTGKIPFEDGHLQGDKMSRNIRAGERPLFPHPSPKYLANFTKRCWHSDPTQRPTFSSLTRMLRYIKRFLVLNADVVEEGGGPTSPAVDYFEMEGSLSKKILNWGRKVSDVPFQMFAYRVMERERTNANCVKEKSSDSGSENASVFGDENGVNVNGSVYETQSSCSGLTYSMSDGGVSLYSKSRSLERISEVKTRTHSGQKPQKRRPMNVSQLACGRSPSSSKSLSNDSPRRIVGMSPRRHRGAASDSEM